MHAEPMGTPDAVIATRNLTKHYGSVKALVDLTLDVRAGEIFGFLGPNGAGKSTMIRTLLGFLHPTSGSASVLGLDVTTDSAVINRWGVPSRQIYALGPVTRGLFWEITSVPDIREQCWKVAALIGERFAADATPEPVHAAGL